jgi:hypothetical protein
MANSPRRILSSTYVSPTSSSAVGIWTLKEQLQARNDNNWPGSTYSPTIEYLIAGGGGSGGGAVSPNARGGGGGAGALVYGALNTSTNKQFNVIIGGGGAASASGVLGKNGTNTTITNTTPTIIGNFSGANYLTFPALSAIGTGDYTAELWIYPTAATWTTGNFYLFDMGGITLQYNVNQLSFFNTTLTTSSAVYVTAKTLPVNTWTHIAIARQSGTTRMFVNGSLIAFAADSFSNTSTTAYIGVASSVTNYFTGYITNFRVVKGVAVYTTAFTPPTKSLTITQTVNTNGAPSAAITSAQTVLLTLQSSPAVDAVSSTTLTNTGSVTYTTSSIYSPLDSIVALGGGGGGSWNAGFSSGLNGASGGGSGTEALTFIPGGASTQLSTYGYGLGTAGGSSTLGYPNNVNSAGGGGGGSGRVGYSVSTTTAGYGGGGGRGNTSYSDWLAATNIGEAVVNGGSLGFSGTNQYLLISQGSGTSLNMATNQDFTVECWVYLNAHTNTNPAIFSNYSTAGTGALSLFAGNTAQGITKWNVFVYNQWFNSTNNIVYNAWNHVAIVRSGITGNNVRLYVNGVLEGSIATAYTGVIGTAVTNWWLGTSGDNLATSALNGSISNFRVTNRALYTGTFTPPTALLSTTQNSSTGIAAISNPLLSNSWSFNGTTQLITSSGSNAFQFGSGDFTVEYWAYYNAVAGVTLICGSNTTTTGLTFGLSAGKMYMASSALTYTSTGTTVVASTWNHFSFVRKAGIVYFYLNGNLDYVVSYSTTITELGFAIGASNAATPASYSNVYISQLRVIKGIALYWIQTNITLDTAPLTATSGLTQLLLRTYDTGTALTDSSSNALTASITNNGTVAFSALSPFTTGGSLSFNGTTKYLTIPTQAAFQFSTNKFVLETWVYYVPHPNTRSQTLVGHGNIDNGFSLGIHTDGRPFASVGITYGGVGEGSTLNLTAPNNLVFTSILYASYGNVSGTTLATWADGTNGFFKPGGTAGTGPISYLKHDTNLYQPTITYYDSVFIGKNSLPAYPINDVSTAGTTYAPGGGLNFDPWGGTGKYGAIVLTHGLISGTPLVANTWNHIALIREGTGTGQLHLYVNGQRMASGTSSATLTPTGTLYIGSSQYSGVSYYKSPSNIASLRISKSATLSVYNAPTYYFTPPSTALSLTQSATDTSTAITAGATSLLAAQTLTLTDTDNKNSLLAINTPTTSSSITVLPIVKLLLNTSKAIDNSNDALMIVTPNLSAYSSLAASPFTSTYSTYYAAAGGAGGGGTAYGLGGLGGGGVGGFTIEAGSAGLANTGSGGGGGGGATGASAASGAGGSGFAIIRYPNSFPDATSTTGSPTGPYNVGNYKYYVFTGSGSLTLGV